MCDVYLAGVVALGADDVAGLSVWVCDVYLARVAALGADDVAGVRVGAERLAVLGAPVGAQRGADGGQAVALRQTATQITAQDLVHILFADLK